MQNSSSREGWDQGARGRRLPSASPSVAAASTLVAGHEELARPALDVGLERVDLGGVGLLAESVVEVDELLARLLLHRPGSG